MKKQSEGTLRKTVTVLRPNSLCFDVCALMSFLFDAGSGEMHCGTPSCHKSPRVPADAYWIIWTERAHFWETQTRFLGQRPCCLATTEHVHVLNVRRDVRIIPESQLFPPKVGGSACRGPPGWLQPLILVTLKGRILARWINQACLYEPEPLTGRDVVNNANNAAALQIAGLLIA